MELITIRCDIDHFRVREISQWLQTNVGRMAVSKELITESSPWCAHHYVTAPSIYYFNNEKAAVAFSLRWVK